MTMSALGLRDVEKIERFYLISCTDIPLKGANSLHRSFPALNEIIYNRQVMGTSSKLSHSQSGRSFNTTTSESDATLNSNNRAKLAFFKICDSLGKLTGSGPKDGLPPKRTVPATGSCHLIMNPSMSKEQFIKRLEEGMLRKTDSNANSTLLKDPKEVEEQQDHKHVQSDSVLAKSTTSSADKAVTNASNKNKNSKSTTAIAKGVNGKQRPSSRARRTSRASTVIVTGFLLLVFFGFIKNVTS